MVVIRSKREGFRRCGVAHSAEAQSYPDDFWSDADLERLKAEPMLIVETDPNEAPAPVKRGRGRPRKEAA